MDGAGGVGKPSTQNFFLSAGNKNLFSFHLLNLFALAMPPRAVARTHSRCAKYDFYEAYGIDSCMTLNKDFYLSTRLPERSSSCSRSFKH
jgi:hypothetical protein